ncbi:hypothetical protein F2Q69_00019487 [Brassica cretica]|uniref:Serine-threonine/tyrosine-protein kinase catalytic domain-containing protein n=1 Tax=Brassica cretica TaxID=69181 RepID=A0A8S9QJI2_BRACR|nr:hypothetical protein F2Q69_00019487 [Brassica cretica]
MGVYMLHADEKADENRSNLFSGYSVTGKRHVESLNQTTKQDIPHGFLPLVYEKKYGDIVDQKLNGKYVGEELEKVICVQLMCSQSELEKRPTMSEVVETLMNNLRRKCETPPPDFPEECSRRGKNQWTLGLLRTTNLLVSPKFSTPYKKKKSLSSELLHLENY